MIELSDLLAATGGHMHGPAFARQFPRFCFDSRRVQAGELFLAVKTETGDGHDYILPAVRGGAAGVLCQQPADLSAYGATCVVVDDVRQALLAWAAYALRRHAPAVVAITGSLGKTTTKEAVAAVLAASGLPVFRTQGSYNGRYGLPIGLGELTPEHRIAVVELAGDSFDEVRDLAQLTQPRVGIVTNIHEAHLQVFGSLDAIAREKEHLLGALPADGLAVLNADDARVVALAERTAARAVFIGQSAQAAWRADDIVLQPDGLRFTLRHGGAAYPVRLRLLGRHAVYPALAALAVGHAVFGIPIAQGVAALAELAPLAGRLNPLPGQGGGLLLDDTVSAIPTSVVAALETLAAAFAGRRRLAALGEMEPLGTAEADGYRRVGEAAARHLDGLVTLGEGARQIALAAQAAGMRPAAIFQTYSVDEAARHLAAQMDGQAVVLVKGDRAARLERLAELLLAPEAAPRAATLLLRQESRDTAQRLQLARPDRPTWLEIDLSAIAHNIRRVQEIIGPQTRILAVLKADGYGHGAVTVGRTALNNGAAMLGVACLAEAVTLRRAGIDAPVLILGYTPAWQAKETLHHRVTATVFDMDSVRAFSRAASELRQTARLHVKIDTGMGRLGLLPDEALPFIRAARALPGIAIEGVFTHFSTADDADKSYTLHQLAIFQRILHALASEGIRPPIVHAANSAALLTVPASRFDMVRLGLALYGLAPSPTTPLPPDFRRALAWKTTIAQVKHFPPGSAIGYGNTYRTGEAERIAVIPVGYADGFRRAPGHWGEVLVRGQRAPIVGRVSMDQTMVRVDHIAGVRQGDEVVLIGRQGDATITAEDVAERLGTIHYEVVASILARVPRVV